MDVKDSHKETKKCAAMQEVISPCLPLVSHWGVSWDKLQAHNDSALDKQLGACMLDLFLLSLSTNSCYMHCPQEGDVGS